MPSSLTWLDHDAGARERSLRILALFKEKESRDELGIGGIRDAIADRLFPGTSTIQTRLRYMLLIPWIYQRLEERLVPASKFAAQAKQEELALVPPLLDKREDGVFGRQAGSGLKRLPSSVYWAGLGAWGIRRFQGSQQEYHRAVDSLYERRAHRKPGLDDRRDLDDHHPDSASQSWHPKLPPIPAGFPAKVDLRVTLDEAAFLVDRIKVSCDNSLLGWLVLHAQPADIDEPWLHPQLSDFPPAMKVLLRHARLFADMVEGAAVLYNLTLAELPKSSTDEGIERPQLAGEHRRFLLQWTGRLNYSELDAWSITDFWGQTEGFGHTITPATKRFIEDWVLRVRMLKGSVADDPEARKLVRFREQSLKGLRSRFVNRGALAQWGGYAGTIRLTYRWATVRVLLADLFAARKTN